MLTYNFYLLMPDGRRESAGHHDFSNDKSALAHAKSVMGGKTIEVREGVRILCRVHPDGAVTG
ncbi:MAG TPA: hypothetical protein VKB67_04790 [Rhizomicrobium sp.]|nr:hypothetical protein [Rhizomicrobium sp.]